MSQREGTRVSAWIPPWSFTVGNYKTIQRSIERRSFERKLGAIVRAALAHQSDGLPAGNPQYKLLNSHAESTSAEFASRWNVSPDLLDAQIPAIAKLKSLADPPRKPKHAVLVSLGIVGAMAFFFLMGVLAGLTRIGYDLIGGR